MATKGGMLASHGVDSKVEWRNARGRGHRVRRQWESLPSDTFSSGKDVDDLADRMEASRGREFQCIAER